MSVDNLLAKLDRVKPTGHGRWLARCPSHDDRQPSLSVRELEDGRLLVHCFAGCEIGQVVGAIGLGLADLFPPKSASDQFSGERRPFPAADVLAAIADETMLVATAAANLAQGVELTQADRERLLIAAERIQSARSLSIGERR